jgi:hypothetical protein
VDLTAQRETDEALESPPQAPQLHLTPEQVTFQEESRARMEAAVARLEKISRPGREYGVPPGAERDAVLNVIVAVMLERGILSREELHIRKGRALAEYTEQCAEDAEAHYAANHSDIWTPDNPSAGAAPPPPRR